MVEKENAAAAAAAKEEEELQQTDLERRMEAAANNLEIRMEAATEAAEIAKRGMKEAAKESEVKVAAIKAAGDYVSFAGTLSAATAASTATYEFERYPTSTSNVVGVTRRSGYTLIIIML